MIESGSKLKFREVRKNESDIRLLFDLLVSRKHNISHERMPDFKDHAHFVMNQPYRAWYLVSRGDFAIGTFYLKYDNSIGINLTSENRSDLVEILNYIKSTFRPCDPIQSMVPDYFYINLPSSAHDTQSVLQELGYVEIQRSYKVEDAK